MAARPRQAIAKKKGSSSENEAGEKKEEERSIQFTNLVGHEAFAKTVDDFVSNM